MDTWAALSTILLFFAQAFWQTRAPEEWTRGEARQLTLESPWAKRAEAGGKNQGEPVGVLLLSALPVRQALERLERTAPQPQPFDSSEHEYRLMLRDKPDGYIMLGVSLPDPDRAQEAREAADLERETLLRVGKRKYPVEAVLPPTQRVPYLVLVFPRALEAGDRSIRFELYVPVKPNPYRSVEFRLADLMYHGRPEF